MRIKEYFIPTLAIAFGFVLFSVLVGISAHASNNNGKNYVLSFMPNIDGSARLSVIISSEERANGAVHIPGLNFVKDFSIEPNTIIRIELPSKVDEPSVNGISNLGVRVTSDVKVAVYGLNQRRYTTDAFYGLSIDTLGTEYSILSYRGYSGNAPSEFSVTGIYDGTVVTITPILSAHGRLAGEPFTMTLDANEVFLFNDPGNGDLTGTLIKSSTPVAVFSGAECAYVPVTKSACDHLVEMLPPVSTWGKSFLTVPLATRRSGDVFRILASSDNTEVKINGEVIETLAKGKFVEKVLSTRSVIESSEPVLVAQYSQGQSSDGVISDPFMMLVPPAEQFLKSYTFASLEEKLGFVNNYVNVVVPKDNTNSIVLDGEAIAPDKFEDIGNSGFSGAQIKVSEGSHTISSPNPFGIYVYGFGSYDSYGYPGGMNFDLINSTGDSFAPFVKLIELDGSIEGIAGDFEDLNLNSLIDAGEDLNKNNTLDRRTEDINGNDELDEGEDLNDDGVIDRDTGIFRVELEEGSENLALDTKNFIPGALKVQFTLNAINKDLPASGILVISDGAGNKVKREIVLSDKKRLTNVQVISQLSGADIDLVSSSFSIKPDSVSQKDGSTLIEWRFDDITIDQIEDLSYDITFKNPVPGETRVVTQALDLYYRDINGNDVYQSLGQQVIDVLSSRYLPSIGTNSNQYPADTNVMLTAVVQNTGTTTGSAVANISIFDTEGNKVAEVSGNNLPGIGSGNSVSFQSLWNTSDTANGQYIARIHVKDDLTGQVATASKPFTIRASGSGGEEVTIINIRTTTDKQVYHTTDRVNAENLIQNLSVNAVAQASELHINVISPDGDIIFSEVMDMLELASGGVQQRFSAIELKGVVEGSYQVVARLIEKGGNEIVMSQAEFRVQESMLTALRGKVTADQSQLIIGEPQVCYFTVENSGTKTSTELSMSRLMVDIGGQSSNVLGESSVILNSGVTAEYTHPIATDTLNPGGHACVLQTVIDGEQVTLANAGYTLVCPAEVPVAEVKNSHYSSNLLVNGSFERHGYLNYGDWGVFRYIPGWVALKNRFEIQTNGVSQTATDGKAILELDAHRNALIAQWVETAPGDQYLLSLDYSPRVEGDSDSTTNNIDVYWGHEKVTTLEGNRAGWKTLQFKVAAQYNLTKLAFHAVGENDSVGGLIDNVQLKCTSCRFDNLVQNSSFEQHGALDQFYWGLFSNIPGWRATGAEPFKILESRTGWRYNAWKRKGWLAENDYKFWKHRDWIHGQNHQIDDDHWRDTHVARYLKHYIWGKDYAFRTFYDKSWVVHGDAALKLDGYENSAIRQDITTRVGQKYNLTLGYVPSIHWPKDTNDIEVWWGDEQIDTISAEHRHWTSKHYEVTASESKTALTLKATGTSDGVGGLIDNVSLSCPFDDSAFKNQMTNGSFEDHPSIHYGRSGFFDAIPGWQGDGQKPFEIQFGKVAGIRAKEGRSRLELDAHENAEATQVVRTSAGDSYTLEFSYTPRVSTYNEKECTWFQCETREVSPGDTNQVEVWWDGKRLDTLDGSDTGWITKRYEVVASNDSAELVFKATGLSDSLGGLIDKVSLVRNPVKLTITSEPMTHVLEIEPYRYKVAVTQDRNAPIFELDQYPEGMSISVEGVINWEHPIPGEYPVIVRVSDGCGDTAIQYFTLKVEPPLQCR
ncbi:IgGFc-binding protein [Endozoicomonas numazuensis]|uniref:IgGFc-binding protein n=1 Tax=Endozoicomonas numazuensis TaxID=1137799 RepID=UPI00068CC78F|nr:IgGFc-binding protein [Endozoicomonas numazuensis]